MILKNPRPRPKFRKRSNGQKADLKGNFFVLLKSPTLEKNKT